MTRITDESILRQLKKPIKYFFKYYPTRIKNVGMAEKTARQIVYDFKGHKSYKLVAEMTAAYLKEQYADNIHQITFCCVPASSAEKNELRYKKFSELVCELSGADNGFHHIQVEGERKAVHENRHKAEMDEESESITFDTDYFKGKQIVCFDDVVTTNKSWTTLANKLEQLGADVLGAVFLARTHYKVQVS